MWRWWCPVHSAPHTGDLLATLCSSARSFGTSLLASVLCGDLAQHVVSLLTPESLWVTVPCKAPSAHGMPLLGLQILTFCWTLPPLPVDGPYVPAWH